MRKPVAKSFFQGILEVHLFSSLDGDAHGFIKHCSAAGASSPPEKQTNLKARSSVQQISVEPGQSGEGEMKEDGKEHEVKEKDVSQCTGTKMLAVGWNGGAS